MCNVRCRLEDADKKALILYQSLLLNASIRSIYVPFIDNSSILISCWSRRYNGTVHRKCNDRFGAFFIRFDMLLCLLRACVQLIYETLSTISKMN